MEGVPLLMLTMELFEEKSRNTFTSPISFSTCNAFPVRIMKPQRIT